jgi:hypothetical protein
MLATQYFHKINPSTLRNQPLGSTSIFDWKSDNKKQKISLKQLPFACANLFKKAQKKFGAWYTVLFIGMRN